jgi:hypothetical protein
MSDPGNVPPYSFKLLPRGGSGRDARWAWEIYAAGNLIPVEKGMYWGAESKAYQAAQAAMKRVAQRRAAKAAKPE